MNEKQQQLLFDKGITNIPSDALCSDNALEESLGMVYENGEHRVIQKPIEDSHSYMGTVLYIHKFNGEERCICHYNENIYWNGSYIRSNVSTPDKISVTSIGKTLIINDNGSITYHIWKPDDYSEVTSLPEPKISFYLGGKFQEATYPNHPDDFNRSTSPTYFNTLVNQVVSSLASDDIVQIGRNANVIRMENSQEKYNELVNALYSKNKDAVDDKKGFCRPFFVRYALKLYDGTYTHVSNPVLMMPCVTKNSYARVWHPNDTTTGDRTIVGLFTTYAKLYCNIDTSELRQYDDIIKSIDIFISNGVEVYKLDGDLDLYVLKEADKNNYVLADGIFREEPANINLTSSYKKLFKTGDIHHPGIGDTTMGEQFAIDILGKRGEEDIVRELSTVSVFYKLCSLDLDDTDSDLSKRFESIVLKNLTTQEQLPEDDYFSRSPINAGFMYAYNNRLNLTDATRGFFKGFGHFIGFDKNSPGNLEIYVTIASESGDVVVKYEEEDNVKEQQGIYFYYPDSRAKHVAIKHGGSWVCDAELTEHPGLNGAYYLRGLPGIIEESVSSTPNTKYTTPTLNPVEYLWGRILTSEVNNPYTFKAEGYNTIGTGKVIGISTTTMALSQDQFGRTDLIVFTEDGIWGMQVNGTGLYQSIHPMSREVCNNPKSITQTDGAVFFSSKKGLMVVTEQGVKCMSEQLSGLSDNPFAEYMENAIMAYDYRDSLLWIFNNSPICYVYSIKSGTFARYDFGTETVNNVVNDYPDSLLQTSSKLYSLMGRKDINKDDNDNKYKATIITRPMKLENALALKSLMQIRHIKDMDGDLKLRIFASNNLKKEQGTWIELKSLRGTPWLYYKFRFDFENMKATDRFCGTMVITQERRINKMR